VGSGDFKRSRRLGAAVTALPGHKLPVDPLPIDFFDRPTLVVARELLGKPLVFKRNDGWATLEINEVEAYDGPEDKACHAHCGRTKRSEVLFGPPGRWYVYLCYGVHWLANIVTGPIDFPAAVLIRGAGLFGGPGKLTKAIGLDGSRNRIPVPPDCGFYIGKGRTVPPQSYRRTPRIGIDYAGPVWAAKRYRYLLR